jgi:hypothetical protein
VEGRGGTSVSVNAGGQRGRGGGTICVWCCCRCCRCWHCCCCGRAGGRPQWGRHGSGICGCCCSRCRFWWRPALRRDAARVTLRPPLMWSPLFPRGINTVCVCMCACGRVRARSDQFSSGRVRSDQSADAHSGVALAPRQTFWAFCALCRRLRLRRFLKPSVPLLLLPRVRCAGRLRSAQLAVLPRRARRPVRASAACLPIVGDVSGFCHRS